MTNSILSHFRDKYNRIRRFCPYCSYLDVYMKIGHDLFSNDCEISGHLDNKKKELMKSSIY